MTHEKGRPGQSRARSGVAAVMVDHKARLGACGPQRCPVLGVERRDASAGDNSGQQHTAAQPQLGDLCHLGDGFIQVPEQDLAHPGAPLGRQGAEVGQPAIVRTQAGPAQLELPGRSPFGGRPGSSEERTGAQYEWACSTSRDIFVRPSTRRAISANSIRSAIPARFRCSVCGAKMVPGFASRFIFRAHRVLARLGGQCRPAVVVLARNFLDRAARKGRRDGSCRRSRSGPTALRCPSSARRRRIRCPTARAGRMALAIAAR